MQIFLIWNQLFWWFQNRLLPKAFNIACSLNAWPGKYRGKNIFNPDVDNYASTFPHIKADNFKIKYSIKKSQRQNKAVKSNHSMVSCVCMNIRSLYNAAASYHCNFCISFKCTKIVLQSWTCLKWQLLHISLNVYFFPYTSVLTGDISNLLLVD